MTNEAQVQLEKLIYPREITRETGTRTTRSQNAILQALPDSIFVEVVVELKRYEARRQSASPLFGTGGSANASADAR